tara:strand:- start:1413 stop:1847 length:435 start_codon:yes stop_codon:yes gene_type:complete
MHTHRTGFDPNSNAQAWSLWDSFKIEEAMMIGWWVPADKTTTPVTLTQRTKDPMNGGGVLATSYVVKGKRALIALASWSNATETVSLAINWSALGLKESECDIIAPGGVPAFNRANGTVVVDAAKLKVPAYKGWLLVVAPKAGL